MIEIVSLKRKKGVAATFTATLADGCIVLLHEQIVASAAISAGLVLEDHVFQGYRLASDRLRALADAGNMLHRRPMTSVELERALKRKGYGPDITAEISTKLTESGYLDDKAYAQLFAESRVRRRSGPRAIAQALQKKGVNREDAGNAAAAAATDTELRENAIALLQKWNRSARQKDARKRATAAAAFLLRRGYSGEMVWEIVREVLKADDVDP